MDNDWTTTRWQKIDSLTSHFRGPKYLSALVLCLNRILGVRFAFVSERVQETDSAPARARAIVFADAQNIQQPFVYEVAGLPCASVLGGNGVSIPCNLNASYPHARELAAYCGQPLRATDGRVMGVLAIEHTEALPHPENVEYIIRLLSGRVAAELECDQLRRQAA